MEFSVVQSPKHKFVICNTPNNVNISLYIKNIVNSGPKARVWVRTCQATYSDEPLIKAGIPIYELAIADGSVPSAVILNKWYDILKTHNEEVILVHCIAGLGRAPLMVTLAMMEDGMTPLDSISEVRRCRPGALNLPQIKFISH